MYGSAGLMSTLIERDLIDEYRIWMHPFVIGTVPGSSPRGCRPETWSLRRPELWAPES
jgi:riboflavin biosynthesis pyrimidine reductase